jgi:hypothetical protein
LNENDCAWLSFCFFDDAAHYFIGALHYIFSILLHICKSEKQFLAVLLLFPIPDHHTIFFSMFDSTNTEYSALRVFYNMLPFNKLKAEVETLKNRCEGVDGLHCSSC